MGRRALPAHSATPAQVALLALATLAALWPFAVHADQDVAAAFPPAYELPPLPPEVDSLTPLADAAAAVAACAEEPCRGIVYFWTPRMPLSRAGIPHVAEAAARLGLDLTLVSTEALHDYAEHAGGEPLGLADQALAAGALAHAPSLVVHAGGEVVGPAVLGYKVPAAYASLVSTRLRDAAAGTTRAPALPPTARPADPGHAPPAGRAEVRADYPAVGIPGAYFRWVPGRDAIAYESRQRIWLLDLASGGTLAAPGYIDFVPTPDGRWFVTPGPDDEGLEFYDADAVFAAARAGRPAGVEPIFTDARMRDQYPSVGILERDPGRTRYRVLTSWFEGLRYRDYDVRVDSASGAASVRPIGEPVEPCAGRALSTPILSQDGRRIAARDERSGTTKVVRIDEGGGCTELVDLGMPTSKVAWHASGEKLAFASPRRSRGQDDQGIYVLDLTSRALVRLPGAERASRLAFPEFVGDDAVIFLIPAATSRDDSVFRVVEGIG